MEAQDNIADWRWRITHLYKIKDQDRRLVLPSSNPIWDHLIRQVAADRKAGIPYRSTTIKARQMWISTFFLIYYLDDTVFHENTTTGILAHKWESLGYLFDIVKTALESMPDDYRPKVGDDSKTTYSFPELKSKIFVSLSIESVGLHNLHISEVALCQDSRVSNSLVAAKAARSISQETIGNGVGNYAYENYHAAKAGENSYHHNFFPWPMQRRYRIPLNGVKVIRTEDEKDFVKSMKKDFNLNIDDEQILFRRDVIKEHKKDAPVFFAENDDDCFLRAGLNFFDLKKAHVLFQEAKEYVKENPPWKEEEDYIAWEKPCGGDIYVAGADPAEGVGADYSVLSIINVTKRRQAFRFKAHVGVDKFYKVCNEWGRIYNNALLAVERNNHGHAVLLGLVETVKYPNLYEIKKETRHKIKSSAMVSIGSKKEKGQRKFGWETTNSTRTPMLDALQEAIEGDSEEDEYNFRPEFLVIDQEFIKEVLSFENNHGKFEAATGKHDDCVISVAIAFQMYLKSAKFFKTSRRKSPESGLLIGSERDTKI